ncbi:serine O-acetyltransferase [Pedobacter endophyticus]|uniref:Serine acetyltransferase n=1 Tax=Pedobacter endophyticus TaxID=2789740 RepID=A0A7U3Q5C4_9SPHI|nr:serine acetyltransferase [Pedobacter endophyticus]QPH38862.1 serine acetyltransferase [Pedobacter endophyticus]
MDNDFFTLLAQRKVYGTNIPSNKVISNWALSVIRFLYPDNMPVQRSQNQLREQASALQSELADIIAANCKEENMSCKEIADHFFNKLPDLYSILNTDIEAIFNGDPAAQSEFEVIRTYPGFYAICFYRIANILANSNVPLIPRILTEHAHSKTGIDIHPSAKIGAYFHIDHGTGIVIGETTVIGKNVKLYQGVTLGALSVRKNLAGNKRHPTVEDYVIIYSGATILGGDTVIGHNSVIGGNVWITESILPYSTAYHSPIIKVRNINETNEI